MTVPANAKTARSIDMVLVLSSFASRRAEQVVEQGDHLLRFLARQRIIDRLGLAAGPDEVILAQPGKMLRQGGLAEADRLMQHADRLFALVQLAKDHQPMTIGEGLEKGLGVAGPRCEFI
ncbi:protein of unknown function (plasmid) [Methylocella tundrae]|uniref:Uncharacterized protein n=1 Tax=Methylocella tundrae TaxID=227605 RepID=A0A4V6IN99_METTU|nr:protein of unknown function [Methylocella tundrae]